MSKRVLGLRIGNIADAPELQEMAVRILNKTEGRGNVVMARLSDDALAHIDQLVESSVFSSRSEATAFLIGAGIQSQKELFDRLSEHTEEIRKLKEQLRKVALDALAPKDPKEKK